MKDEQLVYTNLSEDYYISEPITNLEKVNNHESLAYIIYTSGTTGKPKGVLIEHQNVTRLFTCTDAQFGFNANDVWTLFHSYAFDFSVWEIWGALLYGGKLLVLSHEDTRDTASFHQLCVRNKVTVLNQTPSAFYRYADVASQSKEINSNLRYIIFGGEALNVQQLTTWWDYQNKAGIAVSLINMYGITETTVHVTFKLITPQEKVVSNIGKPISDLNSYILDASLQPVPVGVVGELYIGGAGVARGYLNRPELTQERFIRNPFATEQDIELGYTRLYKTGDTARWLANGDIEYIGRNDDQVKIRGFRIELGEIENILSQVSGINKSCVLVKQRETSLGKVKYLVGYYVLAPDAKELTTEAILSSLHEFLPEYMVPSHLLAMDDFPLTVNGKLDKGKLPEIAHTIASNDAVPTSDLEVTLASIYAEVLGLSAEAIGINQNFFKIGGNSILSIQLKQRLNDLPLFKSLSVADLFKYNTIKKLVASVSNAATTEYKLASENNNIGTHEIAIVGCSGSFSGAADVAALWDLLIDQKEGTVFYNTDACKQAGVSEELISNPSFVGVGGHVANIDQFDPLFWGISPNDAKQLDPQIRKFIEHSWYVLESSGYTHTRRAHHIGVFAGSGDSTYLHDHVLHGEMADQINAWEAASFNSKDALATKVSFLLGLTGPANSINTACSTGLVSIIEACKNLQLGTCSMALAGGVSLSLPDEIGYVYEEGMILSKDGHCRSFDAAASGTVVGSGVGVVLLKRLADAEKAGDTILGVIKGYATNNDGDRKTGFTAPSVIGQSECIVRAQQMAGIDSSAVDYVECHATATPLGDPIEVQALQEAFAFNSSGSVAPNKTILGAIKANIGHADSAAGVAGLIKVCSMLSHNMMPGQANYETPNAELHLAQTNFDILKTNQPWLPNPDRSRIAGVSSFGVGGTNAHIIISDYKKAASHAAVPTDTSATRYVIPLSAKSSTSLARYKKALLTHLTSNTGQRLSDIAYTLQEKRVHFNYRSAYAANTVEELIGQLAHEDSYGIAPTEQENKLVFMFPGQGSQYHNMGRDLYNHDAYYSSCVDHCIAIANQYLDIDLRLILYPEPNSVILDINDTQWAQISLFITEYALAKYLEDVIGLSASAYIGHSIGEYVAACLSGVFSLEDSIRLVIARGQLMQGMEPGSMLAINATVTEISDIVTAHDCEIAVLNSPEDVVASGSSANITALAAALAEKDIVTITLRTSHAYHSRMMEAASQAFEEVLATVRIHKPKKPFISNVTGLLATTEVQSPEYWSRQLRDRVDFTGGIATLNKQYHQAVSFIEVGPGKSLSYFVKKHQKTNQSKQLSTLQLLGSAKDIASGKFITNSKESLMARLWSIGALKQPNDVALFDTTHKLLALPLYQFDHQRCWLNKSNTLLKNLDGAALKTQLGIALDGLARLDKDSVLGMLDEVLGLTKSPEVLAEEEKGFRLLEETYTPTEYKVAKIVGKVLGLDQLSLYDDFFQIGGNSISALQVSHQIGKQLALDIKVADIFKHKNITNLLKDQTEKASDEEVEVWEF